MNTLANQISIMLEMQEAMNTKVNAEWRKQNFEWYRAIWVECAEMLDHYGWKWWKKQSPDYPQVHLELVDIFHFGLSAKLLESDDLDGLSNSMAEAIANRSQKDEFRIALEELALDTLKTKSFNISLFASCLDLVDLSTDELFKQYVGKNTLNFFRQDHGYQDGTYHKLWHGREDNEYLVEILDETPSTLEDFPQVVYQKLQAAYTG